MTNTNENRSESMDVEIEIEKVERSTIVDTPGAVDAEILYNGSPLAVTLCPSEYNGQLAAWGDRDHWISGPNASEIDPQELIAIEGAVRAAAINAGLA